MAKVKKALTAIGKAGLKTVADLDPVSSFFKNVYEEYTSFSAKERAEKVAKTFEDRLEKLEKEIGKQKIVETPNLASLFANAQNGALTDIEEDKIGLYANAFINAIKNESIDDTKKHIFLNMLRDFTKLHIEILKFYNEIEEKIKILRPGIPFRFAIGERPERWYDIAYKWEPTLFQNKTLCTIAYEELVFRKLLKHNGDVLTDGTAFNICPAKQTTKFADEFLSFISEQEEING